jgi:uncharacterized GH25 family protein
MASRNAVILGGLGLAAACVAGALWFLGGSGPAGPAPESGPETAPSEAPAAGPAAGPAPAKAAAAPAPTGDGVLRGRLVRGAGKTPLAGTVKVTGEGFAPLTAEAGADGRFSVEGTPRARNVLLRAEAAGVLPGEFPMRMPAAGFLDVGDLVLGGGVPVEVRVRDTADRPVAGATVAFVRSRSYPTGTVDWISQQFDNREPPAPAFTGSTDEKGTIRFDQAPPGTWFVRASAKGFADEASSVTLVEDAARDPVRLVLGPAFSLGGTVFRKDGKPAEGVLVRGLRINSWWNSALTDAAGRTGADGKYRIEGLARGSLTMGVEVTPGVRVTAGMVAIPEVATWDIRLGSTCGVRGKVVDDASGEPVGGVEITAQVYPQDGMGPQGQARTVAAADGTFVFDGLPAGNLNALNVRAKGYLPHPSADGVLMVPTTRLVEGEVLEKEIRLKRGAVVRGRVLDRTGKPVVSATVRFKAFNPRMGIQEGVPVKVDAEGNYRIDDAPRLKGLLKVDAPGTFQPDYPMQEWQALQQGTMPEACSVEVPAEGEAVKDLVVAPGGAVEGVVADKDGKGAAGVSLSAYSRTRAQGQNAAISDAEGTFRIEGVTAAEDIVVNATGAGGLRGASDPFRIGEGETTQGIRVTLKAAGTIAGRVRREDGATAQGASLRVVPGKYDPNNMWNWNWQRQSAPSWPVGADGSFRAEGVAPGTYTLVATMDGAAMSEGPVVTLAEGEVKEGVEVVLPEERKVTGKVLDPDGKPVAGATIRVRPMSQQNQWFGGQDNEPAHGTTDAAGAFALRGLGKAQVRIHVRAEGFGESSQTVDPPKDDLVFNLAAGLTLEGIITEEGGSAPAAGVNIWAYPKVQQPGMNPGRNAVTGKDGSFVLKDLAAGQWTLTIGPNWDDAKSDWAQKTMQDVEAGSKDMRISLSKGLPIAGKIRDENGKAVTGFWIQAMGKDSAGNVDGSRMRNGQTQPDGSFRIGGLPAGSYDLTFNWNGMQGSSGGFAPMTVRGVQAGTEDVSVVARAGLTISGKIQDEKGAAPGQAGNFQVVATDDTSGQGAGWGNFQPDGSFTSTPLDPAKTYNITVHPFAGFMGGSATGIAAGSKDVIVVVKRGGQISGKIVDSAGNAVAQGVPVLAQIDDSTKHNQPGSSAWGSTQANGEFTISGLSDGRFKLTAGGNQSEYRPTTSAQSYEIGSTGVTLTVTAGVTMEGRLVDSKGGWGRDQTWVLAQADGAGGGGAYHQVKNDGSFTIKGLAPGKTKLTLWNNGKQTELGVFDAPSTGLSISVTE